MSRLDAREKTQVLMINHQLDQLLNKLHNRGLNARHLGQVSSVFLINSNFQTSNIVQIFRLVPDSLWAEKSKLLSEMTARVLKNILRHRFVIRDFVFVFVFVEFEFD